MAFITLKREGTFLAQQFQALIPGFFATLLEDCGEVRGVTVQTNEERIYGTVLAAGDDVQFAHGRVIPTKEIVSIEID